MPLCSEPPSHPAWIVPTRLTGLTEFLPREAESVPAPPPRPARPRRHPPCPPAPRHQEPCLDTRPCQAQASLALQAAAFLPAPLSPQGQHQPEGGTRQPPFTPRLRGSGSSCSLSPWRAQPSPEEGAVLRARGRAGPHPELAQPSRGAPLLPGHPRASPQSSATGIWVCRDRHSWVLAPSGSSTFPAELTLEDNQDALVTASSLSQGPSLCSGDTQER